MRRRSFLVVQLVLLVAAWANLGTSNAHRGPGVTVVAMTAIDAHRLAIEGIREALANKSEVRIVDLHRLNQGSSGDRLADSGTRLIIAIGTEALQLVAAEQPGIPVISTMVLRTKPGGESRALNPAATIALDIPLPVLLVRLKQVFPGKTRLGIIRNPGAGGPAAAALQASALQNGFIARVIDCPGPEQLLDAVVALKGEVDFLWCLPDSVLYNSATIKPLILASIEDRLPLIGFSESFARAGAAIGIYPDFRDVGLQTGETAQQIIAGHAVHPLEGPRKLKLAVNQNVLRLLGLRYYAPAGADDFLVLQ